MVNKDEYILFNWPQKFW